MKKSYASGVLEMPVKKGLNSSYVLECEIFYRVTDVTLLLHTWDGFTIFPCSVKIKIAIPPFEKGKSPN